MTLHLHTSPAADTVLRSALTRCGACGQLVGLADDAGVLRLADHDYPAVAGLAGACPSSGRALGRLQDGGGQGPQPPEVPRGKEQDDDEHEARDNPKVHDSENGHRSRNDRAA